MAWIIDTLARISWASGSIPPSVARFFTSDHYQDLHVTLTPNTKLSDMIQAVQYPTVTNIRNWALCGERATWPAIQLLRMRLMLEVELDRCYNLVRAVYIVLFLEMNVGMGETLPKKLKAKYGTALGKMKTAGQQKVRLKTRRYFAQALTIDLI